MFDLTMLPASVPGFEALNGLKRATLHGTPDRRGILSLGPHEQAAVSYNTPNPFARTVRDQWVWDIHLAWLTGNGREARELYAFSLGQLVNATLTEMHL